MQFTHAPNHAWLAGHYVYASMANVLLSYAGHNKARYSFGTMTRKLLDTLHTLSAFPMLKVITQQKFWRTHSFGSGLRTPITVCTKTIFHVLYLTEKLIYTTSQTENFTSWDLHFIVAHAALSATLIVLLFSFAVCFLCLHAGFGSIYQSCMTFCSGPFSILVPIDSISHESSFDP